MKSSDENAWRRRYLRILTGRVDKEFDSQEYLQAVEDLVEEKLLRAHVLPSKVGSVRGAGIFTGEDGQTIPTLKGRLFIEEQKAFLKSKTFLGRLKTNWPLFSGVVGIFVGWSLSLLTPIVNQYALQHTQPQNNAGATGKLTQKTSGQPTPLLPTGTPVSPIPAAP